jgi:8-oxo-dGTP pyrophosphatase MutT (NUDIX family)
VRRRRVVTCFLRRDGHVLLLRRSGRVSTYRGKWAGISGAMEGDDPAAEALREVREETGLDARAVRLAAVSTPLEVRDAELGVVWEVHPVLADLLPGAVPRLDWEHTEARWAAPDELGSYDTVPGLAAALEAVLRA